ncbi:hypothetical protein G6F60_013686 [Rhizopus arrhizus]|nr:hypothetical protein G6F60_013686 [Rhizopus arrhizus]
MRIDIYSDVVCPWCWIGKHRFQQGVQLLGADAPELDMHWQPFQLDPDADAKPVPLREAYVRKFGGVERTEQILNQTQTTARAEGLPMAFSPGQVRGTTLPAHRVLWLAGQHGVQDAVGEAVVEALQRAAARGVQCRVLLDAVGAKRGLRAYRTRLAARDIEERAMLPDRGDRQRSGLRRFAEPGRPRLRARPPEPRAGGARARPGGGASGSGVRQRLVHGNRPAPGRDRRCARVQRRHRNPAAAQRPGLPVQQRA